MKSFDELLEEANAGWCFDCNRPLVVEPSPSPLPQPVSA